MLSSHHLLTVDEARQELRIGRTYFYKLVKDGHLKLIKLGRCSRAKSGDVAKLVADIAAGKVVV
jgi:excisionase family DNA binding protein